MKIIQVLATVSFGDAVSNDALALQDYLQKMGYTTNIYAENVDFRLPKGLIKKIRDLPVLKEDDVILYHLSTGTELNYQVPKYKGKKILIYHNVTPPEYLVPYNPALARLCQYGLDGARYLAGKVDYCLAASEFNKQDLMRMGYQGTIDVLPILIAFEDYKKDPNPQIIRKYKKAGTNVLFTGRIAPNKCQEDAIAAFYCYKKYYDPDARLFLVGSYLGMESYYAKLLAYVKELGLQDVYFTGHVKFDEILAYYHIADLFLCASEHEGFCVPLVEAMYFDVPVIAYDSTAIGSTLGGSGVLMKEKSPALTAGMMNRLYMDADLRAKVIANQKIRLKDFDNDCVKEKFHSYLKTFLKGRNS